MNFYQRIKGVIQMHKNKHIKPYTITSALINMGWQ
jgi:hypothetical protein